jgi:hypothetical protein
MTKAKFTRLCLLPAAAFLTACAGAHSIQLDTQPTGARVYVNDKYVGLTPTHFPLSHNGVVGETLRVKIAKEGYQTRNETIADADLVKVWNAGHASALSSEYGFGNSYTISYPLEPAGSSAPATAPTVHVQAPPQPTVRRSKPAPAEPAKPRPPSTQSWR